MTLDLIPIRNSIRKILTAKYELNPTELVRLTVKAGKGRWSERVVWKILSGLVAKGEIVPEILDNGRKIYRLDDLTKNIGEKLDTLEGNVQQVQLQLMHVKKRYSKKKDQSDKNYGIRLFYVTRLWKTLQQQRSVTMLFKVYEAFTKHKQWKPLLNLIDELEDDILDLVRKQEKQFYQELIWSVQGLVRDEHSDKNYSVLK